MKLTTVRARLTLGNTVILALVLFGFLLVVHISVRSFLYTMMDRGLQGMANRAASMMANPPPEGRMQPPPPPRGEGRRERMEHFYDLAGNSITPRGDPNREKETKWDAGALRQAALGKSVYTRSEVGGSSYRVYTRPVVQNGHRIGVVQVAFPMTDTEALLDRITLTLGILVPVALLLAGLVGLILTNQALRPVRQIADAAGQFDVDDLSQRLPVIGGDEFARLSTAINKVLTGQEEAFTQLKNAIERERRFTSDASHELRTPLTAIKANATLALRGDRTLDQYREAMQAIDGSANMMAELVQNLLLLARSDSGQMLLDFQPVDPRALIEKAVAAVGHGGGDHAAVTVRAADSVESIRGDRSHLERLLVNLLENALRHTSSDGEVTIEATSEGSSVILTVSDTGEGIAPEHLDHLGERFYRADAARTRGSGGTGLGLAICRSIVEAHQGTMSIESTLGVGTRVSIRLPRP